MLKLLENIGGYNMATDKKKILLQVEEVDRETGEILKVQHTYTVPKEPDYVKLYLDTLGIFTKNEGLDKSLNDLLLATLKRMTYATEEQVVIMNSYIKKAIAEECNKSVKRLEQAITIWVKENIMIRVGRGVYKINPYIFGKGDWRDIYNIRASFDFANGKINTIKEYKIKKQHNYDDEQLTLDKAV